MRLGISTGALRKIKRDDEFSAMLKIAAKLPVDHLEILFARPKMLFADISNLVPILECKEISIHGPFFQDESFDPIINDNEILDELEKKAKLLGATHITVHPDLLANIEDLNGRNSIFVVENVKSLSLDKVERILEKNPAFKMAFDPNHVIDKSSISKDTIKKIIEYHLSLKGIDFLEGQMPNIPGWVLDNNILVILETPYKSIREIENVLWKLQKIK